MMAVRLFQLNFRLTGPAVSTGFQTGSSNSLQGLVLEPGWYEALSRLAGKVWYGESRTSFGDEGMPPAQLQFLWQEFFTDPTQWWDSRRSKPTPWHPREGQLEVGMCRKLCIDGRMTDAVDALCLLVQQRCHVPNNLIYCVLKWCIAHKDLVLGKRIHALINESGYEGEAFLATHLVGLYASHGRLEDAMRVFAKVTAPDAHIWAAIIFACAKHGEAAEAIRLYKRMRESTVEPDNRIYVAALKACATEGDVVTGKEVHAHILASPWTPDIFVQTGLLDMYSKGKNLEDARRVFDGIVERNVVTWNAMLGGYAQQGMGQEALSLYKIMQQDGNPPPDSVTFLSLLQACASIGLGAVHQGKQLHAQIEERRLHNDAVLGGSLVNMYAKCGSIENARRVFDTLPRKGVETWTSMMAGYAQQGVGQEALNLYCSMQREGITSPNSVTFVCLLQACASVGGGALHQGKQLHEQIQERGLQEVLGGSLVNMYAKCGSTEDARRVFDALPERDVVTWNAMLAGYAQQESGQEALTLYRRMQLEGITSNSVTFVCLLQACASVGLRALDEGKHLHAQIEERGLHDDVVLGGSLVNMYAKCGSIDDARRIFDRLPEKSVVTWTAMIAGYAQQQLGEEALGLYSTMQQEGITPSSVTFVCLLQACATVAALPLGKQLHAQIEERGLRADLDVGAALVNMYAKCGSMFDSQQVFDSLPQRTIEAWHALTAGYTRQGDSEVVFNMFDRMRLEGLQPDAITFLSVLTVCSHAGLVNKGRVYFEAMRIDHGISPTVEHYTCMMDLLGRAGHLDEALRMAKSMPFPPDGALWLALLGACSKWNNVEIGQQAFEFAVNVDAKDAAPYVLMSNIYASTHMREEAKEMQARRVKSGAWKKPGQSWWTDMGGVVHTFVVGDKKHPGSEGIYARLKQRVPNMQKDGYVPHLGSWLRGIPDHEKEADLYTDML